MYALFLAADMPIQSGPPSGVQADFEAFLEPKVDVFIRVIREKWLDKDGGVIGYSRSDNESDMNIMKWNMVPKVADVVTTPRELIEALNVEMV